MRSMFNYYTDNRKQDVWDVVSGVIDTINPLQWHKEGQARDEARTVRAEDVARDQKNFDTASMEGRIQTGHKYGLSTLASIGAQPSGAVSSVVGQDTGYLQQGGQSDKFNSLEKRLLEGQIRSVDLDNLKKQQELEQPPQPGRPTIGDSFMPGGSQSIKGGRITERPMERTTAYPGKPFMEPGAITSLGFETTPTGLAPIPSSDIKQRIEDSPYELRHFYTHGILPNLGATQTKPPKAVLTQMYPGAKDWQWSFGRQEWQPKYPSSFSLKIPDRFKSKTMFDKYYEKDVRSRTKPSGDYPEGHLFHRKGR